MDPLLILSFFVIAGVYASVGFGGGTSYLAVMSVLAVSFEVMRPAALLCNIVVVTGGSYVFYKEGLLSMKQSWPFLLSSVPLAFVGGYYPIQEKSFFYLLGVSLIAGSLLLWFYDRWVILEKNPSRADNIPLNLVMGGGIGFLSGLVSIGGGIFLSPILHFLRWDTARRISALASVFILANSISGLLGQWSRSASLSLDFVLPLLVAVFAGGYIGSRWGARKFNPIHIRRITAILILVAGINILINH
ncbi:MAG: sulfite exporter TauE/SafE family protein [Cytophagales bacterium]|nr:sulfite exporter TauE/SafE family protein [Cytophagales bacterium]